MHKVPFHMCMPIMSPPAPMNHVKIFKGWPTRDAPSKLVQLWYKTFPPEQRGLVEMKNPTILSNKTSTAWSCAEDQILENKNLRNMILREHTWLIGSVQGPFKGAYMIEENIYDWLGREGLSIEVILFAYIYIYTFIHVDDVTFQSRLYYLHTYICLHLYMCVYIFICIYTYKNM